MYIHCKSIQFIVIVKHFDTIIYLARVSVYLNVRDFGITENARSRFNPPRSNHMLALDIIPALARLPFYYLISCAFVNTILIE